MEILEINLVQITKVQKAHLTAGSEPRHPYLSQYQRREYPGGFIEWHQGEEVLTALDPSTSAELESEFQRICGGRPKAGIAS